jgi:hypothetical protein
MKTDNVNHPKHYQSVFCMKEPECIDFTELMTFCRGNAFKYVWRYGSKGNVDKAIEDLKKAIWYLVRCRKKRDSINNEIIKPMWSFIIKPKGGVAREKYGILDKIVSMEYDTAIKRIQSEIIRLANEKYHTGTKSGRTK